MVPGPEFARLHVLPALVPLPRLRSEHRRWTTIHRCARTFFGLQAGVTVCSADTGPSSESAPVSGIGGGFMCFFRMGHFFGPIVQGCVLIEPG